MITSKVPKKGCRACNKIYHKYLLGRIEPKSLVPCNKHQKVIDERHTCRDSDNKAAQCGCHKSMKDESGNAGEYSTRKQTKELPDGR